MVKNRSGSGSIGVLCRTFSEKEQAQSQQAQSEQLTYPFDVLVLGTEGGEQVLVTAAQLNSIHHHADAWQVELLTQAHQHGSSLSPELNFCRGPCRMMQPSQGSDCCCAFVSLGGICESNRGNWHAWNNRTPPCWSPRPLQCT